MNKEYYVYTHTSLEDDIVFYVGKGRANRAYSYKGRSEAWKVKVLQRNWKCNNK